MEQQQNTQRNAVMTIIICFLIAFIEGIDLQSAGVAAAGFGYFIKNRNGNIANC